MSVRHGQVPQVIRPTGFWNKKEEQFLKNGNFPLFLPLPAAWRRPPLIQLAAARDLVTLPSPTSNELFKLFKLFLDS